MSALAASVTSQPTDIMSEPGIIGFIDLIEPRKVSGWAWNPQAPSVRLDVEVVLDGTVLAVVRAERNRADLARANVGDGQYGFVAMLDEDLPAEAMTRINARVVAPDGEQVPLLNRAHRTAPRLVESNDTTAAELKELREEARQAQRGFQGMVQSALHEMLKVLERMAGDHRPAGKPAARSEAAKVPAPLTTLAPAADRDESDLGELLRRFDSIEASMLRLDKTLSGIDGRLAKIEDGLNRAAVVRPLLAAVSFASVVALVLGTLALFR